MHYNGQVMLTLREHLITPPVLGAHACMTTYLVFVNVITDFYELRLYDFGTLTPLLYIDFTQTIRDWNDLLDSLISSAEMSDGFDSNFTSLVRALVINTLRPSSTPWCGIVNLTFHQ